MMYWGRRLLYTYQEKSSKTWGSVNMYPLRLPPEFFSLEYCTLPLVTENIVPLTPRHDPSLSLCTRPAYPSTREL